MLGEAWRLDGSVALRPEPFGALAYHFGTRRLRSSRRPSWSTSSSLATRRRSATPCSAPAVPESALAGVRRAPSSGLAAGGMITRRETP